MNTIKAPESKENLVGTGSKTPEKVTKGEAWSTTTTESQSKGMLSPHLGIFWKRRGSISPAILFITSSEVFKCVETTASLGIWIHLLATQGLECLVISQLMSLRLCSHIWHWLQWPCSICPANSLKTLSNLLWWMLLWMSFSLSLSFFTRKRATRFLEHSWVANSWSPCLHFFPSAPYWHLLQNLLLFQQWPGMELRLSNVNSLAPVL